jgi:hypothetical protein
MYHRHENLFKHTRWYFLVTLVKWKLVSDCLKTVSIVLIVTHNRCMVCAKCMTSMEIFSGRPDGTSR